MLLFRGASAGERRRRIYGLSWTADVAEAEWFARERQKWSGGSVVLETLAPPEAVICAVNYPAPITIDELKRLFPGSSELNLEGMHKLGSDYNHEREYVVDRCHLNAVTVVRRYNTECSC